MLSTHHRSNTSSTHVRGTLDLLPILNFVVQLDHSILIQRYIMMSKSLPVVRLELHAALQNLSPIRKKSTTMPSLPVNPTRLHNPIQHKPSSPPKNRYHRLLRKKHFSTPNLAYKYTPANPRPLSPSQSSRPPPSQKRTSYSSTLATVTRVAKPTSQIPRPALSASPERASQTPAPQMQIKCRSRLRDRHAVCPARMKLSLGIPGCGGRVPRELVSAFGLR